MLFDFKIFYAAGRAIIAGQSPYVDPNFVYPLPTAYFFALRARLPFTLAVGLWWLVSALASAAVGRRRCGWFFRRSSPSSSPGRRT